MVAFTYLIPALTLHLTVQNTIDLGTSPAAGHLIFANILNGSLISEQGFGTPINAKVIEGSDYLTADSDGQHIRLGVRALLQADDGEYLEMTATGVQNSIPQQVAILSGDPSAQPLPYGAFQDGKNASPARLHTITNKKMGTGWVPSFRTSSTKYKALEDVVFVGAGTLSPNDGKSFFAGVKISQLVSADTNITISPAP